MQGFVGTLHLYPVSPHSLKRYKHRNGGHCGTGNEQKKPRAPFPPGIITITICFSTSLHHYIITIASICLYKHSQAQKTECVMSVCHCWSSVNTLASCGLAVIRQDFYLEECCVLAKAEPNPLFCTEPPALLPSLERLSSGLMSVWVLPDPITLWLQ